MEEQYQLPLEEPVFEDRDESITVEEVDRVLVKVKELEQEYDTAKTKASEIHSLLETEKERLLGMMKAMGKTRWEVDGVGGYSTYLQTQVSVPRGPALEEFLSWVKSEKITSILNRSPEEIEKALLTIHSQTLNSFVRSLNEEALNQGIQLSEMPGLGAPKAVEKIRALPKRKGV